jgi:hypothetical protein
VGVVEKGNNPLLFCLDNMYLLKVEIRLFGEFMLQLLSSDGYKQAPRETYRPESDRPYSRTPIIKSSNLPKETRMSDFGFQSREVWGALIQKNTEEV